MDLHEFRQKKICVAVSGGIDSVVLLHYLKAREGECGYFLSAVHCEHGIRGAESVEDMRFVEKLCEGLQVPLYVFFEDCPKRAKAERVSLETAARNFRYERFASLVQEKKADLIALAHHAGDEAETVLFRLSRGTSLTGVGGMVALNGYLLRPLLTWTRADIEAYARKEGLSWREDKTNFERDATRNKLRLDVLPKLEDAVPGAANNLVRFAELAKEDDELLYELAESLLHVENEEVVLSFCKKKPLFRRACLIALKKLGVTRDYTALHLENAYRLQALERGAKLSFPKGVEAEKREHGIVFYVKTTSSFEPKGEEQKFSKKGFDGGRYLVSVSDIPISFTENCLKTLRVDGDKIPPNAIFRFRREGDHMQRFGSGNKSLKKIFNEKKTPVPEREYLPLIAEGEEVYVICGVEISEKVKVTSDTQNILYISVEKK